VTESELFEHPWRDNLFYTSDYFQALFDMAVDLIKAGKAYVDQETAEEIREHRGNVTTPGKASKYRGRPVAENLKLFEEMQVGKHPEGSMILRAKIDPE